MIIYNSDKTESLINNEETFGEDFENQKLINCDNKDIEMIKIEEDDFMKKYLKFLDIFYFPFCLIIFRLIL